MSNIVINYHGKLKRFLEYNLGLKKKRIIIVWLSSTTFFGADFFFFFKDFFKSKSKLHGIIASVSPNEGANKSALPKTFLKFKQVDNNNLKILLRGYYTFYPRISMFCALSQNYQHLFEKWYMHLVSYSKFSKELKNTIKIKVGQAFL